ncbi:acyltransferase family protein [Paludisphaera soli]|uniref:acyltransferase family protein n=1 Tax=Paludisphaera soli TaxID=2712865 RepID=UPI0013ECEAE9|nr:acyltransferase [Paludisphaera soli]
MYFRSLQVMRGCAAVAVVLYHVAEFTASIGGAPDTVFRNFDNRFSMGAWFFFALSGFLMAYMLDTSCDRFLSRRLVRIYPTLWLAAALTLLGKIAVFGQVENQGLIGAMTLLPRGGKVTYPLGVEWTLVYELFFYLVCAAFTPRRLRGWFPAFLGVWGAAIVVANLRFGFPSPMLPATKQIPLSLFNLLFIMGGLGYHAFKRLDSTSVVRALLLAAAVAGIAATYSGGNREVVRFLGLGLTFAAVIVLGSLHDRRTRPRPGGSFFEKLGDASYGLYLIHVPVATTLMAYLVHHRGIRQPTLVSFAALTAALVAGWYFGKVDLRLHQALKGRLIKARIPAGGGLAGPHREPGHPAHREARSTQFAPTTPVS